MKDDAELFIENCNLKARIADLENLLEKMKCCGNCEYQQCPITVYPCCECHDMECWELKKERNV